MFSHPLQLTTKCCSGVFPLKKSSDLICKPDTWPQLCFITLMWTNLTRWENEAWWPKKSPGPTLITFSLEKFSKKICDWLLFIYIWYCTVEQIQEKNLNWINLSSGTTQPVNKSTELMSRVAGSALARFELAEDWSSNRKE